MQSYIDVCMYVCACMCVHVCVYIGTSVCRETNLTLNKAKINEHLKMDDERCDERDY